MLTERDLKVVEFIEQFKIARTSTLLELFYPSYRVCAYRLNAILKSKQLKRERDYTCTEYVYFIKRPKLYRHALFLTDFYRELHKIAKIESFIPEPNYGIIPDGIVGFILKNKPRLALVEIDISNQKFNSDKYEQFSWENYMPYKPELIIVSNKKIKINRYKFTVIKTDLNLSEL